jgi:Protein of unknown function, DUF488
MTQLYTCSYRRFRADMGVPVITSLGLPSWRPEAREWPRCWLLTPTPALFREPDDDVFAAGYAARLERFGAAKIARTLEKIAREHQAARLILLCHEADPAACHRRQFADFMLATTGELIEEAR